MNSTEIDAQQNLRCNSATLLLSPLLGIECLTQCCKIQIPAGYRVQTRDWNRFEGRGRASRGENLKTDREAARLECHACQKTAGTEEHRKIKMTTSHVATDNISSENVQTSYGLFLRHLLAPVNINFLFLCVWSTILSRITGVWLIDGVWIGWIDLLTICIYTDYWHTHTSLLSLLQSPLATGKGLYQGRFFSFRDYAVARWLTLYTWNHSAIFSASLASQPPQISINCSLGTRLTILKWTLLYNHFVRTEEKTLFPPIPLLLLAYSLLRERVYRIVVQ
jgi:hypothetical protein